jgi:hypothetical protein
MERERHLKSVIVKLQSNVGGATVAADRMKLQSIDENESAREQLQDSIFVQSTKSSKDFIEKLLQSTYLDKYQTKLEIPNNSILSRNKYEDDEA